MISLDKCKGSCNILTEIFSKIYTPNKTENVKSIFFLIWQQEKMSQKH